MLTIQEFSRTCTHSTDFKSANKKAVLSYSSHFIITDLPPVLSEYLRFYGHFFTHRYLPQQCSHCNIVYGFTVISSCYTNFKGSVITLDQFIANLV